MTTLTDKEILFCTYYCLNRNGKEAATKSGYKKPEKTAAKLLSRDDIMAYIDRIDEEKRTRTADIAAGYYRLAFGCVSDAVSLLFADDVTKELIQQLDLFNISEIKRPKGGGLEIKFFDRLKALEKLENLNSNTDNSAENSLYAAIENGAMSLRGGEDYAL